MFDADGSATQSETFNAIWEGFETQKKRMK